MCIRDSKKYLPRYLGATNAEIFPVSSITTVLGSRLLQTPLVKIETTQFASARQKAKHSNLERHTIVELISRKDSETRINLYWISAPCSRWFRDIVHATKSCQPMAFSFGLIFLLAVSIVCISFSISFFKSYTIIQLMSITEFCTK